MILHSVGIHHIEHKKINFDYTPYLGQNYDTREQFSTVLSNHSSPLDPLLFGYLYNARMVSKAGLWDVPYIGRCASINETIFVDRGGDHESKEKIIH